MPGFEPGTSATQRRRATRLRHTPSWASVGSGGDGGGASLQGAALRPREGRVVECRRGAALRRDRRGAAEGAAGALALQRGGDRPAETVRPGRSRQQPQRRPLRRGGGADRELEGRRGADPGLRALALGADPGLRRPRRQGLQPQRDPRPGPGRGLRDGHRPPPRAHPSGPAARPPRADPRQRLQPLADLLALDRGRLAAGRAGSAGRAVGRSSRTKTAPSTGSGRSRIRLCTPR